MRIVFPSESGAHFSPGDPSHRHEAQRALTPKDSDEETAIAGIDALAAFIKEIGLPTSFTELGIPADTDFRAIADSTNITAGCCKKLTHDEIYEILTQCR